MRHSRRAAVSRLARHRRDGGQRHRHGGDALTARDQSRRNTIASFRSPGEGTRGSTSFPHGSPAPQPAITIKTLRQLQARHQPFACLTCYDATTARWLQRAGVHVLLVGDTAAEVILGFGLDEHFFDR